MLYLNDVIDLRKQVSIWRSEGQIITLVPTMGNLHSGHLSLVELAQKISDKVIVSIFVNPTQFIEGEDFDEYPRTLDDDLGKLETLDTDTVFNPDVNTVYPEGMKQRTHVSVSHLENILCGAFRPGHFAGVATVVTKLLNMIQPDKAVFGEKDYQQLLVIKRVVYDLCIPVEIIGGPTMRERDGLAISSRNSYLTEKEREIASTLYEKISEVSSHLSNGDIDYNGLENTAFRDLSDAGFKPEYVIICNTVDLGKPTTGDLVVLAAAWLGSARLIDNVIIKR